MAVHDDFHLWWLLPLAVGFGLINYLYAYFVTNSPFQRIPGPFFAKFTNLWMYQVARGNTMIDTIDELHKKNGKVVRIGPQQFSIADDAALPIIYGHGNGLLKA